MRGFKEFVIEEIYDAEEYSRLLGSYMIPFSEKMWQRITGDEHLTMYGIHVTNLEGLEIILKRVLGRKKSLPVMDDVAKPWIDNLVKGLGVVTDGGVILICQGTVIARFGEDIGSHRDKQGRRWVDITYAADRETGDAFKIAMADHQTKIYEKIILAQDENPEEQLKYGTEVPEGEGYDGPEDYWRSNDVWAFESIFDMGNGREKRAAFVMYMDAIETELKNPKWKDMLAKLFTFGSQRLDKVSGTYSGRQMWNEMFMIDTRILKAMIIVDSKGVNLPLRFIDDPKSPFPKIARRIRNIEYYHTIDNPLWASDLDAEVEKITQLNRRIKLNHTSGFDFPTEY